MEGMRVGSERLIVVPKHLAYSTQSGPVPGKAKNSPHLNFEIELVDMQ
jgi:FKBP-type peptidyl-prolyl cis-trans isomerase